MSNECNDVSIGELSTRYWLQMSVIRNVNCALDIIMANWKVHLALVVDDVLGHCAKWSDSHWPTLTSYTQWYITTLRHTCRQHRCTNDHRVTLYCVYLCVRTNKWRSNDLPACQLSAHLDHTTHTTRRKCQHATHFSVNEWLKFRLTDWREDIVESTMNWEFKNKICAND